MFNQEDLEGSQDVCTFSPLQTEKQALRLPSLTLESMVFPLCLTVLGP